MSKYKDDLSTLILNIENLEFTISKIEIPEEDVVLVDDVKRLSFQLNLCKSQAKIKLKKEEKLCTSPTFGPTNND